MFSTISEILIFNEEKQLFMVCIVWLQLLISVCRRFLYALLSRAELSFSYRLSCILYYNNIMSTIHTKITHYRYRDT